jgi:hypothetical protein
MRMYEREYEEILTTSAPALFEKWSTMDAFHYYLNTRGLASVTTEDGMISTMFINVFDDLEDTKEANTLGLQRANIDPTTKLLVTTVGEIVFDHTCVDVDNSVDYDDDDDVDVDDDDDGEEENCMTIGT